MNEIEHAVQLYPADLLERLEFDKLKRILKGYCLGATGKDKVDAMVPVSDVELIRIRLQETDQYKRGDLSGEPIPLKNYNPVDQQIRRLAVENYVLPVEGFQTIRQLLVNTRDILSYFTQERKVRYPSLWALAAEIDWKKELILAIDRVFNEEGEVRSDASPELAKIRKQINSKEGEQDKLFKNLVNKFRQAGLLTDNAESIKNGRRVLSVPAEHKRKVSGITHDESSTGRTVYIEPDAMIHINNEIISLYIEEKKEIYKILQRLSAQFKEEVPYLEACEELVAHLDFTRAKSILGLKMRADVPKLLETPRIGFKRAFHPLLLIKNQEEQKVTVPFDMDLHPPNRIVLLSGPNAGGKSVTMKAVGLLQLMIQSGMLVPMESYSEMGVFTRFFADIGDQQSLEEDLSTYSSHLKNMRVFTEQADESSLLLIDEFGSGTDPKMGGAIAESLLKAFNKSKVWGVITTHYSNLKIFAFNNKGIVNGAMTFDKEHLAPTYSFNIGKPGSSFAFEIAGKSGLDDKILQYARRRAGEKENEVDELLVDLQNERAELKEKLSDLEQKEKMLHQMMKNFEQAQKDLEYRRKRFKMEIKEAALQQVEKENQELQKLIRELKAKDNVEAAKAVVQKRKRERAVIATDLEQLREEVYAKEFKSIDSPLEKGSYVRLRSGGAYGIVESLDKKTAIVMVGDMRMTLKLRDLIAVEAPLESQQHKGVTFDTVQQNAKFETKIDIRGFRMDEAARRVQEFMDAAALTSASQVEILHGKGDGILKKIVREKVREYKFVSKVRHPLPENGGDGITIVEFKL